MFRPATYKSENEYELVLMRNRREELIDIPLEYVESIDFEMGTHLQQPTKLTLTIPSHLTRGTGLIEYPLYNMIKGKMQLRLKVNGKTYRLSIEEESVKETSTIHTKTFVAYEIFYKFNTTDFAIATDIATRQLYKSSTETVEVSDGMLNWFEQQCTGWKVGTITNRAKSELTMCSETRRVDLSRVDKTVTDEIFNQNVSISALENKPLNMKLVMSCTVYASDGKKYVDQNLEFEFINLPYAIKNIRANYSSTNKHFYGITFTITHTNDHVTKHEYAFVNCKNVRLVANMAIEYELGNLVERQVTKYRTFDTTVTTWMNMLQQIAESFDVIILFDSGNYRINVCHREEFGELTNVHLSYDNALREITKQRKLNEIVTRLTVESQNTTIAGVNVLGTDYVECYDYFINSGIMSSELQNALTRYNTLLEQKDIEFQLLLVQKHDADQALSLANSQLVSLQGKYSTEKSILSGYVKTVSDEQAKPEKDRDSSKIGQFSEKLKKQQEIVAALEQQVEDKLAEVQRCKDNAASLENQLVAIGQSIKKENTGYFTDDLLLELSDYLIEKAITDDTHLTAHGVYEYVCNQIKEYQKPIIDFNVSSSMEFIKRTGRKVTDCVFIGAKMGIEDKAREITDEGTVTLYGFTIVPSTDEVKNIKFMNGGKTPDSPLKQVSKVAQDVKATKSMTDFYKSTLQQIKENNPDVAKIIEEGLDLAAQKVRSRTESNIIEIDEAGIFLIDAYNENEQLALINDLIAMTTDRWETCRVAISPEGIMAEELLGKIIIGEQLYLGNDTNSFKIDKDGNAYGMFMYSKKNDLASLRVFLGIDKDNQPKLMFFDEGVYDFNDETQKQQYLRIFLGVDENNKTTLIMKNKQNNQIVISPDGMYSCYQISDRDNFSYKSPFISHFFIPDTLDNNVTKDNEGTINIDATLIVRLQPFRAYSRTAMAGGYWTDSTADGGYKATITDFGGDWTDSTADGGYYADSTGGKGDIPLTLNISLSGLTGGAGNTYVGGSGSVNSTTGEAFSSGGRTTGIPNGSANGEAGNIDMNTHTHWVKLTHNHGISVDCGQHKHSITVSGNASGSGSASSHFHSFQVPDHKHKFKVPKHQHKFEVPDHKHSFKVEKHTHTIIPGIFETNYVPSCKVTINGHDIGGVMDKRNVKGEVYTFPISAENFKKWIHSGVNEIKIESLEETNVYDDDSETGGLCRASFTLFWGGFYNYK